MSASVAAPSDHLAPLDGLRGIAIALVVWFHVWQITWLRADVPFFGGTLNVNWIPEVGFTGVDLFFFISGFCLFFPYARSRFDGRPAHGVRTYAYRRAIKILPSYVFAIAVLVALRWATFDSPADEVKQIVLHLLFIHTFWNGSYGSINGVLWSLATEVQFYVVFPLVAWAALRRPWWTFAALALVANAYRIAIAHDYDVTHQMDQLPGVIDLFGAGMLAAYLFRLVAVHAPRLAARRTLWTAIAVGGAAGFVAILQQGFGARVYANWPMQWHVLSRPEMCAAFLALTLGSLFAFPLWQRVLANPVLVFLSTISYNLYLWHQPVARALFLAHVPAWIGASEHGDPVWGLRYSLVAIAAGIAVATATTFIVERPFLHHRPLEPRPARPAGAYLDAT